MVAGATQVLSGRGLVKGQLSEASSDALGEKEPSAKPEVVKDTAEGGQELRSWATLEPSHTLQVPGDTVWGEWSQAQ